MNKFTMAALAVALTTSMGAFAITAEDSFEISYDVVDAMIVNGLENVVLQPTGTGDDIVVAQNFCVGRNVNAAGYTMRAITADDAYILSDGTNTHQIPYTLSVAEGINAPYEAAEDFVYGQATSEFNNLMTVASCRAGQENNTIFVTLESENQGAAAAGIYVSAVTVIAEAE